VEASNRQVEYASAHSPRSAPGAREVRADIGKELFKVAKQSLDIDPLNFPLFKSAPHQQLPPSPP